MNNNNDANFNKRQFWTYKRLFEKKSGGALKNLNNTKSKSKSKSKSTTHSTKKKQFHLVNNKVATDKELVKRLDSIYIPPAYKDIVVAKSPHNKIQAIGTDIRGRRQYVYNHKFNESINNLNLNFKEIEELEDDYIESEDDNIELEDDDNIYAPEISEKILWI
jgi:hypothetical protein